ncbi:MAG: hypothetical protein JNG84_08415 [Archangium sp.]|nr:hypothetical protein [Archangium sp.]
MKRAPLRVAVSRAPLRVAVVFDADMAKRTRLHHPDHPVARFDDAGDAGSVAAALRTLGHRVTIVPLDRRAAKQLQRVTRGNTDLVFNLCDTVGAEGRLAPLVPSVLEAAGVPVVGADQFGLAVSKRKHDVKALLEREGLPTPKYQVIEGDPRRFTLQLEAPVILKLTAEHSSIGIDATSVCFTEAEVRTRAGALLKRFRQPVLVEEFVQGREFYISLAGDPLRALPMMEHTFEHLPDGFIHIRTFDVKWFNDPSKAKRARIDPRWSAPVPHRRPRVPWEGTLDDLPAVCARALAVTGGRDWGRVDFRIDRGGVPMLIDVTPNTYLGTSAPCVKAAAELGLSYDAFVGSIFDGARRRAAV